MTTDPANPADLASFLGQRPPHRHARWRRWGLLLLALLALALLLPRACGGPPPPGYQSEAVRRGDLAITVSATGNLAPTKQIDIGSEISGIVAEVLVDVNDAVTAGQTLAVIDTARLKDAVEQSSAALAGSEASVAQARATVEEARVQLERLREVQRLSEDRVPSGSEMSAQQATVARAVASLSVAEANVVSARAQLSSNRVQLARAVIRSPVAGVVLKRSIDPGQTVQASFNTPSLFIIAEDLTAMKLEVSVDEADVGEVREGQSASFVVDAYPGQRFPARIRRVNLGAKNLAGSSSTSSSGSSNVVSYLANLEVANPDRSLRPGMTATATIETAGEKDALLVPNAALRFTPPSDQPAKRSAFAIRPPNARQASTQERGIGAGSQQQVYVLEADGSLRPLAVTTGRSDGQWTAVTAAELAAGMTVVTGVRARAAP